MKVRIHDPLAQFVVSSKPSSSATSGPSSQQGPLSHMAMKIEHHGKVASKHKLFATGRHFGMLLKAKDDVSVDGLEPGQLLGLWVDH